MQTHVPDSEPGLGSGPDAGAAVDPGSAPLEIIPTTAEPVVFGVSRHALARAAAVARLRRAGGNLTLEIASDGLRVEAHNAEVAASLRLDYALAPALAPGEVLTVTLDPDLILLLGEPRLIPDTGAAGGVDLRFALPRPGSATPLHGQLAGLDFEHAFPFAFAEPLPPMPEVAGETLNVAELREVLTLLDGYAVADPERILGSTVRLGPTAVWAHLRHAGRVLSGFPIAGVDACLSGPAAKDLRALLRLFDPVQTRIAAMDEHCVLADADGWCRVAFEAPDLPMTPKLGSPVVRLTLASDALARARAQILALEEISHGLIDVAIRLGSPTELAFGATLPAGEATARCPALEVQIPATVQGDDGASIDTRGVVGDPPSPGQAGQDVPLELPSAAPLEPIAIEATWLAKLVPARTSATVELLCGPRGLCLVEADGVRRIETFVGAKRSRPQD